MSRKTVVPLQPNEYPPEDPKRIEVDGEFVTFRGAHKSVLVFREDLAEFLRPLWEKLTDQEVESIHMDVVSETYARWSEGVEKGSFIGLVKRVHQAKVTERPTVIQDGDRIVFDEGDGYMFSVPTSEFATPIGALQALARMARGNLLTMKHIEQLPDAIAPLDDSEGDQDSTSGSTARHPINGILTTKLITEDRPQIALRVDPAGFVLIDTAWINDNFKDLGHVAVKLPWHDLPAVIKALQTVVDDCGIK